MEKPAVSDDLTIVSDKLIVSEDDSFAFVQDADVTLDKPAVSEDLIGYSTEYGDFVIDQDVVAELMSAFADIRENYFISDNHIGFNFDAESYMEHFVGTYSGG